MVDVALELEQAILALAHERGPGATLCPSEAARRLVGDDRMQALMPATRHAVSRLADRGLVDVLQGNVVVDARTTKGPIRVRLRAGA